MVKMNEKAKYLAILLLAMLVSATTSYIISYSTGAKGLENQQASGIQSPDGNRIDLQTREIIFDATGPDYVIVAIAKAVDNLTIVYQYTCLNGTVLTESIDYGSYTPCGMVI
jgi:hypothetical protein